MFENIIKFFKKIGKNETKEPNSKDKAKERLHLVLMQDRANVSADFLEMMKQEIIEVIKKYIEVEEDSIDVRLTNELKEDGTPGAPSLYANIPILHIKNEMKKEVQIKKENSDKEEKNNEEKSEETSEGKEEKSEEVKTEEKTEKNEDNQEEQKEEKKNEKVEVEKVQEKDNEKKDEDKKEKTKEDVKSGKRQENKNTKNSNQKNKKNKK